MSTERCQVCGKDGEDRRTLRMRYFYNLSEISDKLVAQEDGSFSILTCKDCRGDFLGLLRRWINGEFIPQQDDNPNRNIPMRVDGRVVMMTTEEWKRHTAEQDNPGKEPIRLGA